MAKTNNGSKINNVNMFVVEDSKLDKVGGQSMNLSIEKDTKIIVPEKYMWLSEKPTNTNIAPRARLVVFTVTETTDHKFIAPAFLYRGQLGRRDAVTREIAFNDEVANVALRGTLRMIGDYVAGKQLVCTGIQPVTTWKFTDKGERVTDEHGNYETAEANAYQWTVEDPDSDLLQEVETKFKEFCTEYGLNGEEE
jgi:hypothetical protein